MKKKPKCYPSLLYMGIGALTHEMKEHPVEGGTDDNLAGWEITLKCQSSLCRVTRANGTAANDYKLDDGTEVKGMPGFNRPKEPSIRELPLTTLALLLFIEYGDWEKSIKEALILEDDKDGAAKLAAMIDLKTPLAAKKALLKIAETLPKETHEPAATSRTRAGEKEIAIEVRKPKKARVAKA